MPSGFNLCVITAADERADHVQTARAALAGGADMIQLRDKVLDADELLRVARRIMEFKATHKFRFIVNDSVEVALKSNADGVHLGQDDDSLAFARDVLGPDKLIGISTHTQAQAQRARQKGADYIGYGPMFATLSKDSEYEPRLPEDLLRIAEDVGLPVLAIGGITAENAQRILVHERVGLAVIGSVRGENMEAAVNRLAGVVAAARQSAS